MDSAHPIAITDTMILCVDVMQVANAFPSDREGDSYDMHSDIERKE